MINWKLSLYEQVLLVRPIDRGCIHKSIFFTINAAFTYYILHTTEDVITSLSHSSGLLLERTGIIVDSPFMSSFLPVSLGSLIKAKRYSRHLINILQVHAMHNVQFIATTTIQTFTALSGCSAGWWFLNLGQILLSLCKNAYNIQRAKYNKCKCL